VSGRRLAGTTPRRGFRQVALTVEAPLEAGVVYAIGPGQPLRLGPLVQLLAPSDSEAPALPEVFLLETGGRREARLRAFPSGYEVISQEAREWLECRTAMPEEPKGRGPRFSVPMVGRRADCEEFFQLLRRVMSDRQGQVLLIEGEAGIGKTKFVQFCREAAASLQVRVLSGAFRDQAGGAYGGIREAMEYLFGVEMLERAAVAARIAERLSELGYRDSHAEADDLALFLTQFLRPMAGAEERELDGAEPDVVEQRLARRDALIERIARFLRRASLHVPLLLLLEDLHWADAESLALLQYLASLLVTDPARLLIVATMRAKDREPNPPLATALQKMARFEGTVYRRSFHRLGEDDTARLIEEVLQADLEDKAALYRLTEGNPLHILSILRYLDGERLLEAMGTGWRVKPGVQLTEILPPTVREMIGLRVQQVVTQDEAGPARQEMLAWAAVAGRRFNVEVLAEAVQEGAPQLGPDLDTHLDVLVEAGLLHDCPGLSADVLEFDHHLLREVVLVEREGRRSERQAQRVRHRSLAGVKLRRVERGERSLLPEVAHHYLEAREWTEAVRYYKQAGKSAQDSLAFIEAIGFYQTATRLLEEHPGLPLTANERAELHYARAEVEESLGRIEEAMTAYRATQAEANDNQVLWARSERSIAFLFCLQGQLDQALAACERARQVLEAAGAEVDLADVLRTLGVVQIYRGQYEAAMTYVQRALAIYERVGHREGLARCYGTLAHLYHGREDVEAMLDAAQHALAIWQELDLPVSLGRALNNVGCALLRLGRDGEAVPLLARAAEILEQQQMERDLSNVYHSLAEALLKGGRGVDARPYLDRGLEMARRKGEVLTVADFHRLLARQAAATGQLGDARAHFEEALRVCAEPDLETQKAQICMEFGEFLLQAGDPEEALHRFEEALAMRQRLGIDGVEEAEAALTRARQASAPDRHN
jgi:predicted ATPase